MKMKTEMKTMGWVAGRILVGALLLWSGAMKVVAATVLEEAKAAYAARDFGKAAALLEPLTGEARSGRGADDAEAFHLLSQVRLAERNTEAAVELAEKATTLDATKAAYFGQLGVALGNRMGEVGFMQQAMMAGKLKKAFEMAVKLDPNDIAGLIGLSRYYSQAPEIAGGSVVKARVLAERVRELAPFVGETELGGIAEGEENYAAALKHYEAAAGIEPAHGWAQYLCGRMLVKLGRKEEARARFEAALKNDPSVEAAKKALGEMEGAGATE